MLSAILIGNNIVNISASSLSATLAYSFGGYMVSIATAILTVAILVFGEITPKNFATIHAEKISLAYIPIIRFFHVYYDSDHLFDRFIFQRLYVSAFV